MKKVIFGVIFAFFLSAGSFSVAAEMNTVTFDLAVKDKDKDKDKKKKKKCCAEKKGEAKNCCAGKKDEKSCAGKEEKKSCH